MRFIGSLFSLAACTSQEAAILGMHTFFLFARTLLSIYVAYIDGTSPALLSALCSLLSGLSLSGLSDGSAPRQGVS